MEIFYYFYKTFICKTKSVTNFSVGPNHGMACRVSNHKMVGVQNHGINGIQTKEWPGFKTKRWLGFKTKGWSGFKSQRTLTTDYRSGHTTSIWQYRNCWRQIKQIWYVVYITFSRKNPSQDLNPYPHMHCCTPGSRRIRKILLDPDLHFILELKKRF